MVFLQIDDELPPVPPVDVVRARIMDWKRRIEDLYTRIRTWLPEGRGYDAVTERTVPMNEPLMRHYGLPPEELPVLDLRCDGNVALSFWPDALWVYPTNGRIDIVGGHGREYRRLIDTAEPFQAPRWVVLDSLNWETGGDVFDRGMLFTLLGERQ